MGGHDGRPIYIRYQRATRRQFSAADKIHIVLVGLRAEDNIAELSRRPLGSAGKAALAAVTNTFVSNGAPAQSGRHRWPIVAARMSAAAMSAEFAIASFAFFITLRSA